MVLAILVIVVLILGGVILMARTLKEVQDDLTAVEADLVTISTNQTALKQTILDLQAQLAAGTPVTQAQLDDLATQADNLKTHADTDAQP